MKTREEKLVALKILLSVHDINELSSQSKLFNNGGIKVQSSESEGAPELVIVTSFKREISWLLYQFQYVFQEDKEDFEFLAESLKLYIKKGKSLSSVIDFMLKESGKLLSH